jgi:putative phosphoribosyl transferase
VNAPALPFADRTAAGQQLAEALAAAGVPDDSCVVALPRGGLPVALPVAARLRVPLDVLVVRKISHPADPECAIGAIAAGEAIFRDTGFEAVFQDDALFEQQLARARAQLQARETDFRRALPRLPLQGKTVVLVDDGAATGATALAAVQRLRELGAAEVRVALPVAPADTAARLRGVADRVLVLAEPGDFHAVGEFYRDFSQVDEAALAAGLEAARATRRPVAA